LIQLYFFLADDFTDQQPELHPAVRLGDEHMVGQTGFVDRGRILPHTLRRLLAQGLDFLADQRARGDDFIVLE